MVPGLLVLDDYGKVAGETRAVDEFLHRHPHQLPFVEHALVRDVRMLGIGGRRDEHEVA